MKPLVYGQSEHAAADPGPDGLQALACFDGFLAATGRTRSTRRMYAATVRDWLAFGGVPGHLAADRLAQWLRPRRARLAPATINRELKALRRFYAAMRLLGICAADESRKVPSNRKVPQRLVRFYSDDQIGAILAQPDAQTFVGLRDHVMIRMLYETGLRSSELVALGLGDVLPDRTVYVDHGKGGHSRYVPISAELAGLLDAYTDRRAHLRPGKRNALWLTAHGRPLCNARSVWEIVNRHARAALGLGAGFERIRQARGGVPWQGHYPHRLRASFATALLERGCPITVIAQLLGHADVATTQHYLAADIGHLRAAVACHPRARLALSRTELTDTSRSSVTCTKAE